MAPWFDLMTQLPPSSSYAPPPLPHTTPNRRPSPPLRPPPPSPPLTALTHSLPSSLHLRRSFLFLSRRVSCFLHDDRVCTYIDLFILLHTRIVFHPVRFWCLIAMAVATHRAAMRCWKPSVFWRLGQTAAARSVCNAGCLWLLG